MAQHQRLARTIAIVVSTALVAVAVYGFVHNTRAAGAISICAVIAVAAVFILTDPVPSRDEMRSPMRLAIATAAGVGCAVIGFAIAVALLAVTQ